MQYLKIRGQIRFNSSSRHLSTGHWTWNRAETCRTPPPPAENPPMQEAMKERTNIDVTPPDI
ncbi:putative N2,N2-dimethylguanosine tRNA methyltransferase [Histoplasma ohiense]|nr:putative N2,N2-dimethylguanosine tRNA methyltransferase [Histoplasma ohiense (nom. inval.)]